MSMEIVMPKTGLTNTENTLDSWKVKEGDTIAKGQVIAEIESEKTTMPFESPADGIIHLAAKNGDTVAVGGVIAVVADNQAEYASLSAAQTPAAAPAEVPAAAATAAAVSAEPIVMPKTGLTNTENTLDSWKVKEGDTIAKGQVIAEIESEKTTMPFESPVSGIIHITAKEGDVVAVGAPIAYAAKDQAEYAAIANAAVPAAAPAPAVSAPAPAATAPAAAAAAPAAPKTGRIIASPLARKLAKNKGIDLALLTGTGPNGRIVAKDVESYVPAAPAAASAAAPAREPQRVPLTPIRKAIAKNMFNSLRSMAQTSDTVEIDVTELIQMRERLKDKEKLLGTKITVNDLLSYATVKMVKHHPLANASYNEADNELIIYPNVNLSMAVATDYGLVSPVVHDADQMTLVGLSQALRDIVVRARDRQLTPADQKGATLTITNMGVFPVDAFNPILPSPQSLIVGFGRAIEKPWVYNGEICIRTIMMLSVTYDHRAFDGGEIGKIMKTLKEYLECPELFLAQ